MGWIDRGQQSRAEGEQFSGLEDVLRSVLVGMKVSLCTFYGNLLLLCDNLFIKVQSTFIPMELHMTSHRLAQLSQRMAAVTLLLIVVMLLLNAVLWIFPSLSAKDGAGLGFALTDRQLSAIAAEAALFPWWQTLGAIVLSSVPLLALAFGLSHLRRLFQSYARGEYFSSEAALHLGKVGRAVGLWVLLDFFCEPLLSMWVTMHAPVGARLFTISVTAPTFVALFLAACISIIARILWQASEVDSENRAFI
jgi:hypothetical protein